MEWQPIDTAPKNTCRVRLGRWEIREGEDKWVCIIAPLYEKRIVHTGFFFVSKKEFLLPSLAAEMFTHWTPLPEPPTK